jgi:hypothetical protein
MYFTTQLDLAIAADQEADQIRFSTLFVPQSLCVRASHACAMNGTQPRSYRGGWIVE